jgi:soluble lytic murein transglycosylase
MAFSVIYDWRLNGTVTPLTTRLSTIGQPYAMATANAARKTISCPSSASTTPAAATSTADATGAR